MEVVVVKWDRWIWKTLRKKNQLDMIMARGATSSMTLKLWSNRHMGCYPLIRKPWKRTTSGAGFPEVDLCLMSWQSPGEIQVRMSSEPRLDVPPWSSEERFCFQKRTQKSLARPRESPPEKGLGAVFRTSSWAERTSKKPLRVKAKPGSCDVIGAKEVQPWRELGDEVSRTRTQE